jgi:hypothetical protein
MEIERGRNDAVSSSTQKVSPLKVEERERNAFVACDLNYQAAFR